MPWSRWLAKPLLPERVQPRQEQGLGASLPFVFLWGLNREVFGLRVVQNHCIGGLLGVKLEFLNPSGSIKARIARYLIERAEAEGLLQKGGWFDASFHVPGIVRDPTRPHMHGTHIDAFTESVDLFPTLCELIGEPIPRQCDGRSLTPWLDGRVPDQWRDAAVYEWDWRDILIQMGDHEWPWDRRLERSNLAVVRDDRYAYVQFGDGDTAAKEIQPVLLDYRLPDSSDLDLLATIRGGDGDREFSECDGERADGGECDAGAESLMK